MKSRFENAKKDNKGFSLVELIIAVVILGIIAVVAIGGLYGNVNKSRVNTDVANARDIQSALSTLAADKDVYTWAQDSTSTTITITWKGAHPVDSTTKKISVTKVGDEAADLSDTNMGSSTLLTKMTSILTDGLPAPKAGGSFELTITPEVVGSDATAKKTGNVSIKCVAKDKAGTVLVEAE